MTSAAITKTLKKLKAQPSNYSLGFRRIQSLPARIVKSFDLAVYLKLDSIGSDHYEYKMNFFSEMTEKEFVNFLKMS